MSFGAKPTFLGIGAQKCASTWLHDILADHPEVCLGPRKEMDFFSCWFDYGYQWYERQFERRPGCGATGEVSPSYFHGASVPRRVFDYDPRMRLILLLRDPVERAISNHQHEVRTGHLAGADLSFEFGLRNNPSYIEQGLYATHLERWLGHFPREQLHVVLVDDIAADPAAATRGIYRFLSVRDDHRPAALLSRSNEGHLHRYRWLEAARAGAQGVLARGGMAWLWRLAGRAGAQRLYRGLNRARPEDVIPPLAAATRRDLEHAFDDDIRRLERLLGRSLAVWRSASREHVPTVADS